MYLFIRVKPLVLIIILSMTHTYTRVDITFYGIILNSMTLSRIYEECAAKYVFEYLCHCHAKMRIGRWCATNPSFGMTPIMQYNL